MWNESAKKGNEMNALAVGLVQRKDGAERACGVGLGARGGGVTALSLDRSCKWPRPGCRRERPRLSRPDGLKSVSSLCAEMTSEGRVSHETSSNSSEPGKKRRGWVRKERLRSENHVLCRR
jgi:hypothetical protein